MSEFEILDFELLRCSMASKLGWYVLRGEQRKASKKFQQCS